MAAALTAIAALEESGALAQREHQLSEARALKKSSQAVGDGDKKSPKVRTV